MILSRYGTNDVPIGLREYSTVGGTVLKECRSTSPSATRVFRVALSIRAEMSGISFLSSLNRVVGLRVFGTVENNRPNLRVLFRLRPKSVGLRLASQP